MEEVVNDTTNPNLKRLLEEYEARGQLQLAMYKDRGMKSLYLFNKYILEAEKGDDNFSPLASFHKELCNFIQDQPGKKKLVLIPRSHLKTKLISIGYSTFKIMNNPQIRILIYSGTWQMAVDIQTSIQRNIQTSEYLLKMFGDISEGATEWSLGRTKLKMSNKREPTITAAGIDNNLIGGHYDIIIMDDVVTRENVSTMEQIKKVQTRYRDALDLLEPHGEFLVVGTRWHDADLYGWLLDPSNDNLAGYNVMVKRAYEGDIMRDEDFTPLWPGKFSRKILYQKLKDEGWPHFSAQYMNDPVPEEDAVFKRSWFMYYDSSDIRGKLLNKFLLIDPALSLRKDADYTAMVVFGVDPYNNIFILDIVRARLSPFQLINEIFRLRDVWNLTDIGIEEIAFQKALSYVLRDDVRFKTRPFHITELKPSERSKDIRIKGLQPFYENGKVFHNRLLPNNIYLEDELVRFPRSVHDDIIDALAYAPDVMFPARQKTSRAGKRKYLYQ